MPKNEKQQKTSKSKKPAKSGSAAEASVPKKQATKKPRTNRPKDAVKSKAGKASAAARKAKRESGEPVARPCSARRTNGEPCKNSAIRGGTVCARHGGSAPQVRAKANQRLIEMVLPAMKELHKILNKPETADADKLKAIQMVLNRTGYSERQQIDLGLREPNAWDHLTGPNSPVISIARGLGAVTGSDESQALPRGEGGGDDDDDALTAMLDRRDREREREASTRLDNAGHEVVSGAVEDDPGADGDLFGYPLSPEQKRARSAYPTEHDPHPTNGAASGPARVSEQRGPGRTQGR
jgi:hypothetical protein